MAAGKKSFILYADLIHTVRKLPDDKAGLLLKHILSYVNDENPITNDIIVEIAFEPLKQQFKRDLSSWEKTKTTRSESGRLGGIKSGETRRSNASNNEANEANASKTKQKQANEAVNVNVTVTDTVNVNDTVTVTKDIEHRKLKFSETLKPFLETYGSQFLNDFYKYWTEENKSKTKFRQELEKTWDTSRRLETWARNDKNFKRPENGPKQSNYNERKAAAHELGKLAEGVLQQPFTLNENYRSDTE